MWRRRPALSPDTFLTIAQNELISGQVVRRDVPMPEPSPLTLRVEVFPRRLQDQENGWLLTVVLRNASSQPVQSQEARETALYQTYFEVRVEGGRFDKYPESQRPFAQLDPEEQSLSLLYRESATWGIDHGCAASWDTQPEQSPTFLYADVMPAVQTPSMTPDISDSQGNRIRLSMRELAGLPDDGQGAAWQSLRNVIAEYGSWIGRKRAEADTLAVHLRPVANRHLDAGAWCLSRMNRGIPSAAVGSGSSSDQSCRRPRVAVEHLPRKP
jgi:hypothetical protein